MEDRECPSNFEVTHSLSESFSHAKYLCLAQNWDAPQKLTLGEVSQLYGRSVLVPQIVGTASQIVDQLEALFHDYSCDGFVISPAYLPGAFTEFVEYVIPELQHRDLFRQDYQGKTLRDHLQLANLN
jgi:alkanesulfonate monooxygenase SsuD/methylene tetrahydromethanopterin reductase-like flavin-dependent oxidoreductase (luciferase family)